MKEYEERTETIEQQKALIRERYKGINPDELDVIPALPKPDIFKTSSMLRVAVYARVSTDDPRQTSSYELQKNHYQDVVDRNPNWNLVKIYADEGISGTSLQHREAFKQMVQDCEDGKIDLILTKSVSRFARNVVDCIGYVRELLSLRPPVGVFFETEHLNTLDPKSEMILSFMSTLAQEESHTKSEIMNASIEMRFRRGIFLTPPLLGYDQDENGELKINEHEAKIVKLIFYMYLNGNTCQEIADTLTELGCKTKKNNEVWSSGSILQILQNERHCGDVLARKTWTPNYLDHKSRKNNQDRNQYRKREHHEAIISRDDFIAVQKLISNAKYGNKALLPELHVIPDGALKGFITVNPRWAGFKPNDYLAASSSISDSENTPSDTSPVTAQLGSFDLRGYEIAHGQFFETTGKISATLSYEKLNFSTEALRKFGEIKTVELLIHPSSYLLAVRPCTLEDNRNKVQWARLRNGVLVPRYIYGAAFLPTLYELFGWNPNCKYRVLGVAHQKGSENVLIFNMKETEVRIPNEAPATTDKDSPNKSTEASSTPKTILGYPAEWMNSFGNNYYSQTHARELAAFTNNKNWQTTSEGQPYKESELHTTPKAELTKGIVEIMEEIKENRND